MKEAIEWSIVSRCDADRNEYHHQINLGIHDDEVGYAAVLHNKEISANVQR